MMKAGASRRQLEVRPNKHNRLPLYLFNVFKLDISQEVFLFQHCFCFGISDIINENGGQIKQSSLHPFNYKLIMINLKRIAFIEVFPEEQTWWTKEFVGEENLCYLDIYRSTGYPSRSPILQHSKYPVLSTSGPQKPRTMFERAQHMWLHVTKLVMLWCYQEAKWVKCRWHHLSCIF